MANYTKLTDLFTGIANAIRSKTGSSSEIIADNFPSEISGIVTVQEGTSDATATAGDIASGKTAYVKGSKVTGTFVNTFNVSSVISPQWFVSNSIVTTISTSKKYIITVASNSYQGRTYTLFNGVLKQIASTETNSPIVTLNGTTLKTGSFSENILVAVVGIA